MKGVLSEKGSKSEAHWEKFLHRTFSCSSQPHQLAVYLKCLIRMTIRHRAHQNITTPDYHQTRLSPNQTFTKPDYYQTRLSSHQTFTRPDFHQTRLSPDQTFTKPDYHHTRLSPHQTFTKPEYHHTRHLPQKNIQKRCFRRPALIPPYLWPIVQQCCQLNVVSSQGNHESKEIKF